MARRKHARKHSRRRSHARRRHSRMHGLGQMDMSSMMMPAGLGQFDYSPGMSMTTKVVLGAAVAGAAYWYFFMRSPLDKTKITINSAGPTSVVTLSKGEITDVEIPAGYLLSKAIAKDGKSVTFTRGDIASPAAAGTTGEFAVKVKYKKEDGSPAEQEVSVNLSGAGYFSGLGSLGRGYYSGWQGQGDPGTDFQAAGRGYNYGRYF